MENGIAILEEQVTETPPQPAGSGILSGPTLERPNVPAWFRDQQRTAWETFEVIPMPHRKDQAWRFSNVDALDLSPFVRGPVIVDQDRAEIIERSGGLGQTAGRMIFADDQLLRRDPLSQELRDRGVIFQPIERAILEHEELFRRYFMSEPATLGSAKFAALHQALVRAGTFLYVPRGVEIELPIEIFHWLNTADASVFPHMLLVADEMAKVTVIEHFQSTDPHRRGFACGVNDLVVGAGAKVTYICAQNWASDVLALQMNMTTAARDASALSLNLNLGGAYSRFESFSRMSGEGARSDLLAVAVGKGRQEFDARTMQDHACPHTTSDLLYKNALDDRSKNTFGGLIRVEPHAHFTDAYQTVRNLLLSDDAEANSMPGLEILADNVKCSHGATSGQIDEEELFYLLSRGIPLKVAQHLVVAGFLNEVIDRVKQPAVTEYLHQLIEEKFAG